MERRPGALTLSEDDRRVLAVWAADCAEQRLSLFEARAPGEVRRQLDLASCPVRDVLRRLPPPTRPAGMLGALIEGMPTTLARGTG